MPPSPEGDDSEAVPTLPATLRPLSVLLRRIIPPRPRRGACRLPGEWSSTRRSQRPRRTRADGRRYVSTGIPTPQSLNPASFLRANHEGVQRVAARSNLVLIGEEDAIALRAIGSVGLAQPLLRAWADMSAPRLRGLAAALLRNALYQMLMVDDASSEQAGFQPATCCYSPEPPCQRHAMPAC